MASGLKKLYQLRTDFSIIGLTGRKGSGCTEAANKLSVESIMDLKIRRPDYFKCQNIKDKNFIRKYKICYDFAYNNWTPYKIIKYREVVLLHLLQLDDSDILHEFSALFENETLRKIEELLRKHFEIIQKIRSLGKVNVAFKNIECLGEIYFSPNYGELCFNLISILDSESSFKRSRLFHRISNNLRGSGKAKSSDPLYSGFKTLEFIYTVAETINRLIKAWKCKNEKVHIVIDALRNSLEIMFFKERYSAFYMFSVNSNNREENLKNKIITRKLIKDEDIISKQVKELLELDETEYKCNDFKRGDFWSPDLQNCIQKCDIHLLNKNKDNFEYNKECDCSTFYNIDEQIIKFTSLIQQPGLITPSAIERCMQIAYNAKNNSGCISRQVGAVITDKNFSVKAIGWNDIPSGSTPCNLRSLHDLILDEKVMHDPESFSPFERGNNIDDKDSSQFRSFLANQFSDLASDELEGRICSFCFKTIYNNSIYKDNQVHTRSLHAEENAMLQLSKYGGQGIEGGILFTTASPCELCSKKACQLGIKKIYYIDPYPGISEAHILRAGLKEAQPRMKLFSGAVGSSFHKLYEPFMSYKDEISLRVSKNLNQKDKIAEISHLVDDVKKKDKEPEKKKLIEMLENKLSDLKSQTK